VYYSFPAFARWALRKKTATAPADEASAIQTEEAVAGPAKQIVPAEQSGIKSDRKTIEKLDVAKRSGGD
jgi:hypothetical protein